MVSKGVHNLVCNDICARIEIQIGLWEQREVCGQFYIEVSGVVSSSELIPEDKVSDGCKDKVVQNILRLICRPVKKLNWW